MQGLDWAMLLGLALVFGSAFFFGDLGLKSFGPLSVAAGRVSSAAIILTAVALLRGRRFPADIKTWAALLVMGAINNAIPFSLIFWGQTHIASGLASILNATTPLFTVVVVAVVMFVKALPFASATATLLSMTSALSPVCGAGAV